MTPLCPADKWRVVKHEQIIPYLISNVRNKANITKWFNLASVINFDLSRIKLYEHKFVIHQFVGSLANELTK